MVNEEVIGENNKVKKWRNRFLVLILVLVLFSPISLLFIHVAMFLEANPPVLIPPDVSLSGFLITEVDYDKVDNLINIDEKLGYRFFNNDGTSGIVYDGQIISSKYPSVGEQIINIDGSVAYVGHLIKDTVNMSLISHNSGKKVVVYNGKVW